MIGISVYGRYFLLRSFYIWQIRLLYSLHGYRYYYICIATIKLLKYLRYFSDYSVPYKNAFHYEKKKRLLVKIVEAKLQE